MIKLGSLFSGIGGFELGLERAIPGLETVWQVEQNKFCQQVLKKHWKNSKIYNDVKTVGKYNLESVDILCGGFPCQDISVAGKGKGINEGKKSSLWWEMHRIISELRPRVVVLENVPAIIFRGLDDVLGSLSEIGYDAEWTVISAQQFGAPHLRKRWFCVAYPKRGGVLLEKEKREGNRTSQSLLALKSEIPSQWSERKRESSILDRGHNNLLSKSASLRTKKEESSQVTVQDRGCYWREFPNQSPLRNRDDGIPNRVARLRALGNAIVPQCSQYIGECILRSGLLEER